MYAHLREGLLNHDEVHCSMFKLLLSPSPLLLLPPPLPPPPLLLLLIFRCRSRRRCYCLSSKGVPNLERPADTNTQEQRLTALTFTRSG